MRSDIAKVITERPRRGSRSRGKQAKQYKKRFQDTPLDEQPHRESMLAMWYGEDTHRFTDVLAPLEGFIRKNIRRPWDNVFSEVARLLPAKGGVSVSHARGHLFDFVDLHVVMVGNVPHIHASLGMGLIVCYKIAFVHPVTGLLLLNRKYENGWINRQREQKTLKKYVVVSNTIQFHQAENGVWYELTLAKVPDRGFPLSDAWLGEVHWSTRLRVAYGNDRLYCVSKRQARRADIKQHGLGKGGPITLPNIVQTRNRRKPR